MPFFIDWPQMGLAWAIMAVSALLQGSVGFGYALIAGPLLILLDPIWVPGPLMLGVLPLTIGTWKREWPNVDPLERRAIYDEVLWSTLGRVPGIGLGAMTLLWIPRHAMGILVGGMVLLAVLLSLVSRPFQPCRPSLVWAGLASGFMGTTASIGGPPLALLYQYQTALRFRATLAVFFTVGATMALMGLTLVDRFGWHEVLLGVVAMPGVVAGFWASGYCVPWLAGRNVRPWVLALATLSALAAIAHGSGLY